REAEENADADNKAKEEVDKLNAADSLIFQTEKQMAEFGDKLPVDKKEPIESALDELKKAHEAKDFAAMEPAMEKLNTVFQAASQEMYAQGGAEGNAEGQPAGDAGANEDEVTDVDFEEVEEEEEKK
ncbi:Hsp70 family protein, partial [Vicingaceae bacterium]|nr:Hsp70 family protein [Vicingaceae bacterium]